MYTLFMVTFDGDYVKDSEHNTIEEAQDAIANMGSKWFFYPFPVIVKNHTKNKIIAETGGIFFNIQTGECLLNKKFQGKHFNTLLQTFTQASKKNELLNADADQFEHYILENY